MNTRSRTGLVPTPQKSHTTATKQKHISSERLPKQFEAQPMPLSLRPFGGLFNPFAKGCSVLCNHPAPTEVKHIISQLKTSIGTDGKSAKDKRDNVQLHETDNIPEDLFRRYTDTDSRPLTPTPTVTSIHTRNSGGSFLNNRRCITPELGKNEIIKRKKIILDLRRSHSQETLYWKPSSDMSQSALDVEQKDKKPKSADALEGKKPKRQKSEEHRPKSSLDVVGKQEGEKDEDKKIPKTCINDRDFTDIEEDVRRGKKRKKLKPTTATTTFHLSEDPETQIATLGPDSLNPSTRPSLIPNSVSLMPDKEKRESDPLLLKGSFLTDDAFQAIKIDLDIDVIENTFGRYLNRALREAIKYIPPKPKPANTIEEEVEKLTFAEKKMPRKFSKSATRFEVPFNLRSLEKMTVLDYLSKFVWVSQQRKRLYKRVFLKYYNAPEDSETGSKIDEQSTTSTKEEEEIIQLPRPEYVERTMSMSVLPQALEDVLEFHGTEINIKNMLRLLDYENEDIKLRDIDFRTWCGIVSFAERLALDDPTGTDSCDELEKVDFSSMEERLRFFKVPPNLQEVFDIIRKTHTLVPSIPQDFKVERLHISRSGISMALAGPKGVAIMELPLRYGKSGQYMNGKEKITCGVYEKKSQPNLFAE
ncbi:uncharacterized protein LOC119666471 [Teleopsis dalmanni]|uniref:uncharacterized protein LOC119666471 n=1 Tax=Teleopsis dalmanni TaxID=139649 RepID=UPI0018CD858C|nr:uncharacterized protein LOC119666471 [Teleopsis dalmanni]